MTEKQPQTNDYRTRAYRPLFVQTFTGDGPRDADEQANDYSERVSDLGGEVVSITCEKVIYQEEASYDYRYVAYRATRRIDR